MNDENTSNSPPTNNAPATGASVNQQPNIDPKSREAIDQRIKEIKEEILKYLKEVPFVIVATQKAGVDKSTYYRWLATDKVFANKVREAKKAGMESVKDSAFSVLVKNGTGEEANWRAALELIKYIDRYTSEEDQDKQNPLGSILSNPEAIGALGEILKVVGEKMKKSEA